VGGGAVGMGEEGRGKPPVTQKLKTPVGVGRGGWITICELALGTRPSDLVKGFGGGIQGRGNNKIFRRNRRTRSRNETRLAMSISAVIRSLGKKNSRRIGRGVTTQGSHKSEELGQNEVGIEKPKIIDLQMQRL